MGSGSLSEVTREFMCPFMKCGYDYRHPAAARCGGTADELKGAFTHECSNMSVQISARPPTLFGC